MFVSDDKVEHLAHILHTHTNLNIFALVKKQIETLKSTKESQEKETSLEKGSQQPTETESHDKKTILKDDPDVSICSCDSDEQEKDNIEDITTFISTNDQELSHLEDILLPQDSGNSISQANTIIETAQEAIPSSTVITTNTKHIEHYTDTGDLSSLDWMDTSSEYDILIVPDSIGISLISDNYLSLERLLFLVIDECEEVTDSASELHKFIHWLNTQQYQPRILAVTTFLLNIDWATPNALLSMIEELQTLFKGVIQIDIESMVANIYGSKIKEELIFCPRYVDTTGLVKQIDSKITDILSFLENSKIEENMTDEEKEQDITYLSVSVLEECRAILKSLGPWCAGQVAKSISKQVVKMEENESLEWPKLLLQLLLKELCEIYTITDLQHYKVFDLEGFHTFLSPRVISLVHLLYSYKPNDNFVIVGDGDYPDMDGMSDDSFDSLDLSDHEAEDKGD